MKITISSLCLVLLGSVLYCTAFPKRSKRAAYDLPAGTTLLLQNIQSTFSCSGDGYYADVDNNCQIFHVCHGFAGGRPRQYSFACGNQTVFNQLTFTCSYVEDAVPCQQARDYFYLNDNVQKADPKVQFLSDNDIQNAAAVIPRYSNRG